MTRDVLRTTPSAFQRVSFPEATSGGRVETHELGDDANAVGLAVLDHGLDVVLGVVVLGGRGHLRVERRVELALHAEAAHVRGVEVEHWQHRV